MRMFKTGLVFLVVASQAMAEQGARGAQELLGFFGSQCVANGSFASEALTQSDALIHALETIKDDDDCKTVAGVMGQLQSLRTFAFELTINPDDTRLIALERQEEVLQRLLQTATVEELPEIQSNLLSVQLEIAQHSVYREANTVNQKQYDRQQLMTVFLSNMQSLLSQTNANMACWTKYPSLLQGLGQLVGATAASTGDASLSIPLQGLVNLTGSLVEYARGAHINRAIRDVSLNIRKTAYICTLESLANTWCSAYEGQQAIKLELASKRPKNDEDKRWQGLSLLNNEIVVLREWLSAVRSGSQPSSLDIGEQKSVYYKREQVVQSTEAKGIGLIRGETQIWEQLKSNLTKAWTFEKKLIKSLAELVYFSGGGGPQSGGTRAPTTERYSYELFPYYMLGFFDNPSLPIPVPKNFGSTLDFDEFDPIINSYPGFTYTPSLTAIESRFSSFIQEAKEVLEVERASKVQLDPSYLIDLFISNAESFGKPSPQTATKKIIEFLKDQLNAVNGLPVKYRDSYGETIVRLERIVAEIDLHYDKKKPAADVIREIYTVANLLAGVRDLIAPIERAVQISLNTEVIEQMSDEQLLGVRLLAARSVVDQLSLYTGQDSPIEIKTQLGNAMSTSQSNILNFLDYFSDEITVSLKDYDRLAKLANENSDGPNHLLKNHLCLLIAANNTWPKGIPYSLCDGAQLSSAPTMVS